MGIQLSHKNMKSSQKLISNRIQCNYRSTFSSVHNDNWKDTKSALSFQSYKSAISVKNDVAPWVSAMRHGVRTKRLGRPADQRKSMIRSIVSTVLTLGRIKTTLVRAKYVR